MFLGSFLVPFKSSMMAPETQAPLGTCNILHTKSMTLNIALASRQSTSSSKAGKQLLAEASTVIGKATAAFRSVMRNCSEARVGLTF